MMTLTIEDECVAISGRPWGNHGQSTAYPGGPSSRALNADKGKLHRIHFRATVGANKNAPQLGNLLPGLGPEVMTLTINC